MCNYVEYFTELSLRRTHTRNLFRNFIFRNAMSMMQMTLLQMNNIYVLEYCRVLVAFVFAVSF